MTPQLFGFTVTEQEHEEICRVLVEVVAAMKQLNADFRVHALWTREG